MYFEYSTRFTSSGSSIPQCCLQVNMIAWKKGCYGCSESLGWEKVILALCLVPYFLCQSRQASESQFSQLLGERLISMCWVQLLGGNQKYSNNNCNEIGASGLPGTIRKTSPALFLFNPHKNPRRGLLLLFLFKKWGDRGPKRSSGFFGSYVDSGPDNMILDGKLWSTETHHGQDTKCQYMKSSRNISYLPLILPLLIVLLLQ